MLLKAAFNRLKANRLTGVDPLEYLGILHDNHAVDHDIGYSGGRERSIFIGGIVGHRVGIENSDVCNYAYHSA